MPLKALGTLKIRPNNWSLPLVVNTAYQVGWFVLQGWKDLGKQSLAHLVLGGRSSKVKGVMGPLQVVDVPPQVEGSLVSAPDQ